MKNTVQDNSVGLIPQENKDHDCFDHLDEAVKVGRAKYLCPICKKDISLVLFYYQLALYNSEK